MERPLQRPDTVSTNSTAANSIVNGISKTKHPEQKTVFLFGARESIRKSFPHIMRKGKKKLPDYFTKNHTILHHRNMQTRILKPTRKDTEKSEER